MEIKELHRIFLQSSGASTDTRKIKDKCIFFALKGSNFNGNSFALQALENGADFAVVDEILSKKNKRLIDVQNVLQTLQDLASFHREYLKIPIIGLTGSNGKTTTKEFVNKVLSTRYRTVATKGNLNNHIGVPLTLLSMNSSTEIGVVEMGANHPGEIATLCEIAQPDYGYITNFGKAHLEGFKSLEGVIRAKSELYDFLIRKKGTLFLNCDDPVQQKRMDYEHTFTFGSSGDPNIKITFGKTALASISFQKITIQSNLTGQYNASNIAAAFAVGLFFEIAPEDAKTAIEAYDPQENRSQIIGKGSNRIIMDAYNANPTSMAAALENLENLSATTKVAILGDMFEVGDSSEEEHQQIANILKDSNIDEAYLIGNNFYQTDGGSKIKKFRDFAEIKTFLRTKSFKNATILLKGSRGMALERVLEFI